MTCAFWGSSFSEPLLNIILVIKELQRAGFCINFVKSSLTPSSVMTCLGIVISLDLKTLSPSFDIREACVMKASAFIIKEHAYLKNFQSLIGSLNFAAPQIQFGKLQLAPLHSFTHYFSDTIKRRVPFQLKTLLVFWLSPDYYVACPIPDFCAQEIVVHPDTSQQGWGAQVIWPDSSSFYFQGRWEDSFYNIRLTSKKGELFGLLMLLILIILPIALSEFTPAKPP